MSDYFKCPTHDCNQVFFEPGGPCPQCGLPVLTPRGFKINLWLRLISGIVLSGMMLPVLYFVVPPMLFGGENFTNPEPAIALAIVALLAAVTAFGLAGTVTAFTDMQNGARSRGLARFVKISISVMLAVLAVFLILVPEARPTGFMRLIPM
ncbi:MAG: hypothetical protein AAFR88_09900 [Pseudomonadota bacterium]